MQNVSNNKLAWFMLEIYQSNVWHKLNHIILELPFYTVYYTYWNFRL